MSRRTSTALGILLILASFPLLALVARQVSGLAVVAAGIVAYVILGVGVYLARTWLGVAARGGRDEQVGCVSLLVTLVALVSGIAITYYVVLYGAMNRLSGSGK